MAVWVYKKEKDGSIKEELIEAAYLQGCLDSGYVVDKSELSEAVKVLKETEEEIAKIKKPKRKSNKD